MTEKSHNARKARAQTALQALECARQSAPLASVISATPARHLSLNFYRRALRWKIAKCPSI
jgi:hypothetical protein